MLDHAGPCWPVGLNPGALAESIAGVLAAQRLFYIFKNGFLHSAIYLGLCLFSGGGTMLP